MKDLCVIFLLLCSTKVTHTARPVVVTPSDPVLGVVGNDLVLPCCLKNNISAVDMEVQWLIADKLVFNCGDDKADQLEQCKRTSLFKNELQNGNISLRLSSVTIEDTNTYRCYVSANEGTEEAPVKVKVYMPGNKPEISAESHYNGSVTLVCKSTKWPLHPVLEWMDGMGRALQKAQDPTVENTQNSLHNIQRSVTVEKQDGYNYTCRVSYGNYRNEETFAVPGHWFEFIRHRLWLLPVIMTIMFGVLWLLTSQQKRDKALSSYRKQIRKKFADVNKFYTELPIVCSQRGEHSIMQVAHYSKKGASVEIPSNHHGNKKGEEVITYQPILVEQFFSHEGSTKPNVVILEGISGYGKSFTMQKIMYDWAKKELYSDQFDLVVLLKCDDLTSPSQTNSLLDLVSDDKQVKSVVEQFLRESPHKVLFIIDAFDYLKFSEEDITSSPTDPLTPASTKAFICSLLSGHILPESSLLITTRPSASDRLNSLLKERPKRFTVIQGFTEEKVKDYFQKISGPENKFQSVKAKTKLFNFCFNPLLCWMICRAQKDTDWETNTMIYLEFVASLLPSDVDKRHVLSELGQWAKEKMEDVKTTFSLPSVCTNTQLCDIFVCVNVNTKSYSFKHQSFMEFFTALYIVLDETNSPMEVEKLLILVQSAVQSHPHLQPVIKFLFGLSNESVRSSLQKILGLPTIARQDSLSLQTHLKHWILGGTKDQTDLFLLHCLYELHDEGFVEEVMDHWDSINLKNVLTNVDCCVLKYCLQRSSINRLDLGDCNLTVDKLDQLKDVWETLKCDELKLAAKGLENKDIKNLISLLEGGIISSTPKQNELDREEKPKKCFLRFLSVKSFSLETAVYLLNLYQKTNTLHNVSLEVDKSTTCDENFCSSLSVNTNGSLFTLTLGKQAEPSGTQQAGSELYTCLSLPASEISSEQMVLDWKQILQKVQSLSLPDLKWHELLITSELKLEICVTDLPKLLDNNDILYNMLKSHKRPKIKVLAATESKEIEAFYFSSLTLSRVDNGLRLEAKDFTSDTLVSIMLSPPDDFTSSQPVNLLNQLLSLGKTNAEVVTYLETVLSLEIVKTLELRVTSINVKLATVLLSIMDKCKEKSVFLKAQESSDVNSVCSRLHVSRNVEKKRAGEGQIDDSTSYSARTFYQLSIKNTQTYSSNYTAPALSDFKLSSKSALCLNWDNVFTKLHNLRYFTQSSDKELGECVQDLISQSDVEEVELKLKYITEDLATKVFRVIKHNKIHVSIKTTGCSPLQKGFCSSLCVDKDENSFRLSITGGRMDSKSATAAALFVVTLKSKSPSDLDWKCLFSNEECLDFISTPNAERVELIVNCIPVSLAKVVLAHMTKHDSKLCPSSVSIKNQGHASMDSFCSNFHVDKDEHGVRLEISGCQLLMKSNSGQKIVSAITLKADSPLIKDWTSDLHNFDSSTPRDESDSSSSNDDSVGAFLSSLPCLGGIKEMELFVKSMSDDMHDGIQSLMKANHSIQETRVSCGKTEPENGIFAPTFTIKRVDL